jgi:hypothetical protein
MKQLKRVVIVYLACVLSASATAQDVVAETNPTAKQMAKLLIDKTSFKLIESGPHAPTFSGPPGSAKLIKDVGSIYLPNGAVKLQTITGAKGKSVVLKFSAISKVIMGLQILTCLLILRHRNLHVGFLYLLPRA